MISDRPLRPADLERLLKTASADELTAILLALTAERPELTGPLLEQLKAMKSD